MSEVLQILAIKAQVTSLEELSPNIYQVRLQAEEEVNFKAGQYAQVQVSPQVWLSFSIANRPQGKLLELHIQHFPDGENSQQLFQLLKTSLQQKTMLNMRLGMGDCFLKEPAMPLVLIAAGTGFAQIKALVEEYLARGWNKQITFYWAAKSLAGLYNLELVRSWQEQLANLEFIPVVEELQPADKANNQVRTGLVTHALQEDFSQENSASAVSGFICGSPNMVYAVEDLLMTKGMPAKALLSDAHSYAPRSYEQADSKNKNTHGNLK